MKRVVPGELAPGCRVYHTMHGNGTVVAVSTNGEGHEVVTIDLDEPRGFGGKQRAAYLTYIAPLYPAREGEGT